MPSLDKKSEVMPYKQLDELPSEIKEQLPEHGQQIFLAASNSAEEDGMNKEAALSVAWNSVKNEYEKGEDGKWHLQQEDTNIHRKGVQSGGN